MAPSSATCGQCGSTKVRHARSRNDLHRLLRRHTPLDRYACGDCGHRGWRLGKLPHLAERPLPGTLPAAGRPVERRDQRGRRRLQLRVIITVAIGLALGVVAAWFVLRLAASPIRPHVD